MYNKQNVTNDLNKMLSINERRMNLVMTIVMIIINVPLMIEVMESSDNQLVIIVTFIPSLILSAVIVLNLLLNNRGCKWIKYLNLAAILFTFFMMSGSDNESFYFIFILPSLFSSFYFRMKYTIITSVSSIVTLGFIMLNNFDFSDPDNVGYLLKGNFSKVFSKMFDFSGITERVEKNQIVTLIFTSAMICVAMYISFSGRRFFTEQAKLIHTNAVARNELDMAKDIQNGALSHDFPDNSSYAICADMRTAAEVGGDFYDHFMIDDTHLAIVVGDVSGHGMAAAMFMMLSKTLIKVYSQYGLTSDKVLSRTNKYLLTSNPEKYFVTGWLGIIDLTTGMLSFTNAGHNYPVIIRKDGKPGFLTSKTCFVLGRRRLAKYNENHIRLAQGDRILLYTDGVTEARSPQDEFFGDDRLLESIGSLKQADTSGMIKAVRLALCSFENGQEPYDDITMLAFELKEFMKPEVPEYKKFTLSKDTFDNIIGYISDECRNNGCSDNIVYTIMTACSEILANIESYAYKDGGDLEVLVSARERRMIITFKDNGAPFDPLLAQKPDVTLPLNDRSPGGLGILIVKKLMDHVSYRYENGQNTLTIEKDF